MAIVQQQLQARLITSLAILALFSGFQPASADGNSACGEEFLDKNVHLQPGERTGILHDLENRKYILAEINIAKSLAAKADQTIAAFIEQSPVKLVIRKGGPDRYGRMPVHVFSGTGRWLQKELITAGLALVNPAGSGRGCLKVLFQAESRARNDKIGVWQASGYVTMRSQDGELVSKIGSYRIVEGIVLSVGETGSRVYLNFGKNWQDDFTVIVAKSRAKRLNIAIGRLKNLAGRRIRVRGWMVEDRGPMIEAYYPGQIELDVD